MTELIRCLGLVLFAFSGLHLGAGVERFSSEDGRLGIIVHDDTRRGLTVLFDQKPVLDVCGLGVAIQGAEDAAAALPITLRSNQPRRETIHPAVPVRRAAIDSRYREIVFDVGRNLELTLRLYDRAVAYRFALRGGGTIEIRDEQADFRPAEDLTVYFPEETSLVSHYEGHYQILPLSDLKEGQMAHLPLLMKKGVSDVLVNFAVLLSFTAVFAAMAGRWFRLRD